jgi:predicted nucleic acid-binding protein
VATAGPFWKKIANSVYLDSAYLAKYYVNERDSVAVRALIRRANSLVTSAWALGEVTCAFHRHLREGSLSTTQCRELTRAFLKHVDDGVWTLIPVGEALLKRMSSLVSAAPAGVHLRAGDAVHLITARDIGEAEIWTNDRHLVAAAPHFGLVGRSV